MNAYHFYPANHYTDSALILGGGWVAGNGTAHPGTITIWAASFADAVKKLPATSLRPVPTTPGEDLVIDWLISRLEASA